MGINGLLPFFESIQKPISISKYKGRTIAIDGHCILHRGCFGAATALALKDSTDSYVKHFMHYVGLLKHYGITPIVVFDGLPLPLKKITTDDRSQRRQDAYSKGISYYAQGMYHEAKRHFQQSVTITPEIIRNVILKLKEYKIECIVAPYEADAQLAYLIKTKKADAVLSEDSDLLAYGCSKVIYKIDRTGSGVEIAYEDIFKSPNLHMENFTQERVRHMCILSGCDYLPSVKGVGIKTSFEWFYELKTFDAVFRRLQHRKPHLLPKGYAEQFKRANLAFLHQWVYDMDAKDYVRFSPLPSDCDHDYVKSLGKKPTPLDLSLLRVNKIIPRKNPCLPTPPSIKNDLTKDKDTSSADSKDTIATATTATTKDTLDTSISSNSMSITITKSSVTTSTSTRIATEFISFLEAEKENIPPSSRTGDINKQPGNKKKPLSAVVGLKNRTNSSQLDTAAPTQKLTTLERFLRRPRPNQKRSITTMEEGDTENISTKKTRV
ncbi:MAG: PIN domain-like protein [Benjaminiella poitrasii]|nr:MAG: PIN domain-like protein [Benjaminiella poitrasii]